MKNHPHLNRLAGRLHHLLPAFWEESVEDLKALGFTQQEIDAAVSRYYRSRYRTREGRHTLLVERLTQHSEKNPEDTG